MLYYCYIFSVRCIRWESPIVQYARAQLNKCNGDVKSAPTFPPHVRDNSNNNPYSFDPLREIWSLYLTQLCISETHKAHSECCQSRQATRQGLIQCFQNWTPSERNHFSLPNFQTIHTKQSIVQGAGFTIRLTKCSHCYTRRQHLAPLKNRDAICADWLCIFPLIACSACCASDVNIVG